MIRFPFIYFFTADCVVYIIVSKRILSILLHSVHLFLIIFPVMKRKKKVPLCPSMVRSLSKLSFFFGENKTDNSAFDNLF